MTGPDLVFFERCFDLGLIRGPLLEVGSARVFPGIPNLCDEATRLGVTSVVGTDLQPGSGVDFCFDFAARDFEETWTRGKFSTVAIFSVLEHTFDPLTVLRNALRCVADGGCLLIVTPAVWPIHNWPGDFVRLLPNWYERFAESEGLTLLRDCFCWIGPFGVFPIREPVEFPNYLNAPAVPVVRKAISRVVHRAFNTYGRSHSFTHACVGAAMRREG